MPAFTCGSTNSTQGSVLAIAMYHVLDNTYGVLIGSSSVAASCVVNVIVAGILIAVFGPTHLSRRERVRAGSRLDRGSELW
ncbi:hypothetical protein [Chthonomonas calidirosea]|uniref:hypothetical protein n=1 Tax=Chthonomonas calidirosea TaxID=454171 RepID=UPI0012E34B5D|nr:hypothetical protein [Chthonomonas calidirosea]